MRFRHDWTYKTKLSHRTKNELNNVFKNCGRNEIADWVWDVLFHASADRQECSMEEANLLALKCVNFWHLCEVA